MTVDIKEMDGKTVVTVAGEMNSITSEDFQKEMAPLVGREGLQVEIDMAGLTYISSRGLRVILALAQSIMPTGGRLTVVNTTPPVRMVFDLSGFSTLFLVR